MSRPAHGDSDRVRRSRFARVPAGPLSVLEILLLGPLAALLVLAVIPAVFRIESACVGVSGVQPTAGDTYLAGLVVAGTLGWLGVFLGTIYASIAERRDVVVLLPLLWFLALVLGALLLAIPVGPVPCPS